MCALAVRQGIRPPLQSPLVFGVPSTFCDDVRAAMLIGQLPQRISGLHHQVERAVAEIGPRCEMSGRCCRFEEYGHRLFVTTAEVAVFASSIVSAPAAGIHTGTLDGEGCRFQVNGICTAHQIRPIGCRLFFCDNRHEEALQSLYEEIHRQLKALHTELGIAYAYVEWRQALAAIEPLWREQGVIPPV